MRRPGALLLLMFACVARADGPTIVSSKHDLSVTGTGKIHSLQETQVCIFCHVGHQKGPGDNRPELRADYQPYQSSTLTSQMTASPTGASRICLSCHDGTIALGETVASGVIEVANTAAGGRLPEGDSNLGTDLRKTHPISFVPRMSATTRAPEGPAVKLDRTGAMQCTSCHDPHRENIDPVRKKFLVQPNRYSSMCLVCHVVPYWNANPSSHQSSLVPVDASRTSIKYPYATVSENGCESCHRPHNASEHGRLVRGKGSNAEQQVCMNCHNGRVAKTDLTADLAKSFAHQLPSNAPDVHDAAEAPQHPRFQLPEQRSSATRHVTCVDCHNPHASSQQPADGLRVSGALAGVWGIDQRGERVEQIRFEYELCFKCHGDSANKPTSFGSARGQVPQRSQPGPANLRLAFASDAPSAHPVVQPGRNPDVPGLKAPWTISSLVTCSDCHSSDTGPAAGGQGPRGPHGSNFEFLLERNYVTADKSMESPSTYALCYKCHEREVLLSEQSAFKLHRRHVVDSATPCSACHAAHGVSALNGTPQGNARLIDYDTAIVGPGPMGLRGYRSDGVRAGSCSVSCHGVVHDGTRY